MSPMQRVAAVWSPRRAFMHEFIVKEDAEERMRDAEQRARERAAADERARRAEEILSRVMLPVGEYDRAAPPRSDSRPSVVLARARSAPGIAQPAADDDAAPPQPSRETPVPPPSPEVVAADAPVAHAARNDATDDEGLPGGASDDESAPSLHVVSAGSLRRAHAIALASSPSLPPRPPVWALAGAR